MQTNTRIFIGGLQPLPDNARLTGMFKRPASGRLDIGPEGFVGDMQADRRVHGGPEKAIHLYPAGHYARLAERFPEAAPALVPGSLGENLSAAIDEAAVCLGDVFALGDARLQLCQPRNPCWKIDSRFGVDGMALHIERSGLTGWYFRVLRPGTVETDAAGTAMLALIERRPDPLPLADVMAAWRAHRPAPAALERAAAAPGVAAGWRDKLLARADWLRRQAG